LSEARELVDRADAGFALTELAATHKFRGDLANAKVAYEQALKSHAEVHGQESQRVAIVLHSLGGVLQAQGDLEGARGRLERSLSIKAEVFGTELHPSVAASLHSLGGVLQAQGDLEGARGRLERVLEIEVRIYGTREHYSTAITELTLAVLLAQLGEPAEARALGRHALAVFERRLGADHHWTRRAVAFLASLDGAGATTPARPSPVLDALAAVGTAGVGVGLLRRLVVRTMFRRDVPPALLAALLAADADGRLPDDPAAVPAPDGFPAEGIAQWVELTGAVAASRARLLEPLDLAMAELATQGGVVEAPAPLPEATESARWALVDEAVAALRGSAPGAAEAGLWAQAAAYAMELDPRGVGTTLPRALLAALPAQRAELLARWRPVMSVPLRARIVSEEAPAPPPRLSPYLMHALAALDGAPVGPDRLRRLAVRTVLRSALPDEMMALLNAADLASPRPGSLVEGCAEVPPPPGLPADMHAGWREQMEAVDAQTAKAIAGIDDTDGELDVHDGEVIPPADLPSADSDDRWALVDEAFGALGLAHAGDDDGPLRDELPLWIRAAIVAIELAPRREGTGLPRALLAKLPDLRESLLATWAPHLGAQQRARIEGDAPPPETPSMRPYVLGVLAAAAGAPVSPARARRLARRSLLRGKLGSIFFALLHTDLNSAAPGTVVEDPRRLSMPEGAPPERVAEWSKLTSAAADLLARFGGELDEVVGALPAGDEGLLLSETPLPEADDDDRAALVDEALAVSLRARATHDVSELTTELDLWTRAAALALEAPDDGANLTLARLLVDLLPTQREELLAAWTLSPDQRARLTGG